MNVIACENSKTGTPQSTWDIYGVGDTTIQGYGTEMSVQAGETIDFKVASPSAFTAEIYRLGYYNGDGARKWDTVDSVSPLPANSNDDCTFTDATETFDCGAWGVSASWDVPENAVSGVYIARLIRNDTGGDSHIPFIVRDDSSHSNMVFQTSDPTWQAYNRYGGSDFYSGGAHGRAYKLSYNRPWATRGDNNGRDFLFSNEYPMIRFMEQNGYDVSYISGIDTDVRGNLLKNHDVFLSVGHDEYWSGPQRANVEAARDAGTNLAFFAGNDVYWKTRWENGVDAEGKPYRTLVCYKETWANSMLDPDAEWTGTWRDPRFTPPKNGGKPENSLIGTMYVSNYTDLAIKVPAAQGKMRLWRNSSVAGLGEGETATLAPHTIGYESNEDLDNGYRPEGLIRLSETTGDTPEYLRDFGNTVTPGTTTHHITLYKASSGAQVFSAGTVQWAWGLDARHDGGTGAAADPAMRQATVNLFTDMGVQPTIPVDGITVSTASTDAIAPTAVITSPDAGTTAANGAKVTVKGTASDVGGEVAGVEVSTDGGQTWHPADGTTNWEYSFYTTGVGSQTLLSRAVDDSNNIGEASTPSHLVLTGAHTIFGKRTPVNTTNSDGGAVELGVRFKPEVDGRITGIRFYKGEGNTGTHTGTLWNNVGDKLGTATFADETASGWQTVKFAKAINVTAGSQYVASYFAPNGHYATDAYAFSASDIVASPLVANRSGSTGNGLFKYDGGFPNGSYGDANYYVDVMFLASADAAPVVTTTVPAEGQTDIALAVKPKAVFSKDVDPAEITFAVADENNVPVTGSVAYDEDTRTATFKPAAALNPSMAYTATVTAADTNGTPLDEPATWTFNTEFGNTVVKLFEDDAVPQNTSNNDPNPVELGVKFTPSVGGNLVGMRYYKGTGNTGQHVGHLWASSGGSPLATVEFTENDSTGWQTAAFNPPVTLTAGTQYVLSYYAPNGGYASTGSFFTANWVSGVLTAPAGDNGVYRYGSGGGFPQDSWSSPNYWVDPLFQPSGTTPVGPSPSPSPSASASASPSVSPSVSVSPSDSPSSSPSVSPSVSTSPSAPEGVGEPSTSVSPSVSTSPSASPSPTANPAPELSIFGPDDTPANANWPDDDGIEVGTKFTTDVAGSINGVKFYKGANNTGTHSVSLWRSDTQQRLAFKGSTSETASGWQTVTFDTPVSIVPGVTYVVSYYSSAGQYAVTGAQLGDALNKAPLHVPAGGGAYHYDSHGGVFPGNSANHNYWVDVVFQPSA
ncbi:hypothetical protein FB565_000128 [Actinoplanes lutulentus]|uniref:DUF4082 domain-containing protein n=1 Tax=Actinoplanes lutulentus TaxID=1287878 RepID=UPI0017E59815|nr:DUF4082 domain-containing protein [Actinoplanes lutulentus]MBB2940424.1 hypothetical protein [Actinoplanes lutulentus]